MDQKWYKLGEEAWRVNEGERVVVLLYETYYGMQFPKVRLATFEKGRCGNLVCRAIVGDDVPGDPIDPLRWMPIPEPPELPEEEVFGLESGDM
jgi:hypothetical protein